MELTHIPYPIPPDVRESPFFPRLSPFRTPVVRHLHSGISWLPMLVSRHCRVVFRISNPNAGLTIAFLWSVVRRESSTPFAVSWISSIADWSMVSPPITVWAFSGAIQHNCAIRAHTSRGKQRLSAGLFIGREFGYR